VAEAAAEMVLVHLVPVVTAALADQAAVVVVVLLVVQLVATAELVAQAFA
jgi:hypothetical protein